MFDHTSRYYQLEVATTTVAGRTVSYVRRRFIPPGESLPLLAEAEVGPDERLDQIAERTLGDPLAWWRVCDANDTLDPQTLIAEPRRVLRVPLPQGQDR